MRKLPKSGFPIYKHEYQLHQSPWVENMRYDNRVLVWSLSDMTIATTTYRSGLFPFQKKSLQAITTSSLQSNSVKTPRLWPIQIKWAQPGSESSNASSQCDSYIKYISINFHRRHIRHLRTRFHKAFKRDDLIHCCAVFELSYRPTQGSTDPLPLKWHR